MAEKALNLVSLEMDGSWADIAHDTAGA